MFFFLLFSSLSFDDSLFNSLSIYQIMVSSFQDGDPNVGHNQGYGPCDHKGDLQGIIDSLDYIKDLGFNAIWMTPIFESSIQDTKLASTGYYPNNYFNIDYRFGSTKKFRELVQTAHSKGIYIILDGVFGHHGEKIKQSPKGYSVQDMSKNGSTYVDYSQTSSLEFFKEVAQYWIEEYEIDGWRLDVAKELSPLIQNGNYLYSIRQAVEEVCDKRRSEGKQWGILGYIVGEFWDSIGPINDNVYTSATDPALRSAFDFPFRYSLVQTLAQDENGNKKQNVVMLNEIKDIHRLPEEKTYRTNNVHPNLFIDNHDTYRFGNLLRLSRQLDVDNEYYWRYHKVAIGILAVNTGPVTLYYGDEIGEITDCWNGNVGSCPANEPTYRVDQTSSSRTQGKISGFNTRQTDLHDYTKALFNARLRHPSMWRGSYGKIDYNEVAKDLLHVELKNLIIDDFYEMYGYTGIEQHLTKISIAINKAIEKDKDEE